MSLDKKKSDLSNKAENIHQDLIDACRENDQKAQFRIYKLYYKAMFNTSIRILTNRTDAEDATQEAFLDAFRKIDQYDGTATFGAWLKRIVINRSLDELKKNKGTLSVDEVESDRPVEVDEDYFEVLSYKIDTIHEAINELPDGYRIVLSLYLLEGYDHEEISQILEISYNNARTKYSRAKQKLLQNVKVLNLSKTINLN